MTKKMVLSAIVLAMMGGVAQAHTGHGASGFIYGLGHPFSGFDHIAAMVAVGFFAAGLGGRAMWAVPASFVFMMVVGGAWGMAALPLPFVEVGITASIFVLGAVALLRWNASLISAMALCGFFAVFHGCAHGFEMPSDATGESFAFGFVIATIALHGLGLALGFIVSKLWPKAVARV